MEWRRFVTYLLNNARIFYLYAYLHILPINLILWGYTVVLPSHILYRHKYLGTKPIVDSHTDLRVIILLATAIVPHDWNIVISYRLQKPITLYVIHSKCCCVTAVLVWLNYKNAYEYWTEQRLALNREVQTATHQLLQKLPLAGHQFHHAAAAAAAEPARTGMLFLQLTVEDLGICLPMNQVSQVCAVLLSPTCSQLYPLWQWHVYWRPLVRPAVSGKLHVPVSYTHLTLPTILRV